MSLAAFVALSGCKGTEPPPQAATINVNAADTELDVGEAVQATVVVLSSAGSPLAAQAVSWSTSESLVARVSNTGVVAGEGSGSATITAVSGSVSESLVVRVVDRAQRLVFAVGGAAEKVSFRYPLPSPRGEAFSLVSPSDALVALLAPAVSAFSHPAGGGTLNGPCEPCRGRVEVYEWMRCY
ncbi:MAG: Ig-like domain-containing protein [Cytophagaceae bacterium]|nr:Ig-like domain-containing protein [Gemmatimonadaceae bacterium]